MYDRDQELYFPETYPWYKKVWREIKYIGGDVMDIKEGFESG